MKTYQNNPNFIYNYCEHMEYIPDKGFSLQTYHESFPIGTDQLGRECALFLCSACGQRIEAKMFLNFLCRMNLKVQIKNGSVIELKSKEMWRMFLEILKVQ